MMRFACLIAAALCTAACSQEASPPDDDATPVAAPAEAVEVAKPQPLFRYTRLDGCTLTRSAPEEAGFFEHECPGEGGYRLRHVESDLRENIVVIAPGGGEHSLELPALANGAFSSTGDAVEWRGEPAGETFAPRALIVRQMVMEDPDPKVPEVSYLVVARLAPTPCVVARVPPGADQNRRGRALADAGEPCLAKAPA